MSAALASTARIRGHGTAHRPDRLVCPAQASSACAGQPLARSLHHREQDSRRRDARMGGARPSLEAAIEAMLEGSRDRCLLCSGQVVRRSADGVLVCRVCESVLTESDTLDAVLLLDAA